MSKSASWAVTAFSCEVAPAFRSLVLILSSMLKRVPETTSIFCFFLRFGFCNKIEKSDGLVGAVRI